MAPEFHYPLHFTRSSALSWARSIQSTASHPVALSFILISPYQVVRLLPLYALMACTRARQHILPLTIYTLVFQEASSRFRVKSIHARHSYSPHATFFAQLILPYKGKAIPLQAWTGPEGSRRLRLPNFKTVGTWRW